MEITVEQRKNSCKNVQQMDYVQDIRTLARLWEHDRSVVELRRYQKHIGTRKILIEKEGFEC